MKNMHKMIFAGGLLACASLASAEETPFSANVALTTDYAFRGISQTAEDPALQGGFDFTHKSGLYAGVWGSNLNFGEPVANDAHLETDLYAGYRWEMAKLKWDVGVLHYAYPGAASEFDYDFTEVYVGAGFGPVTVKASYSDDFTGVVAGDDEGAYYVEANASFDLPMDVALGLHVGKSGGDYFDVAGDALVDYVDYKVSLSKEVAGFGVSLAYIDTDLSGADKIESGAFANDERFVLTLSRSM
jgi:uncharacterized protein (TIGR02001 family)